MLLVTSHYGDKILKYRVSDGYPLGTFAAGVEAPADIVIGDPTPPLSSQLTARDIIHLSGPGRPTEHRGDDEGCGGCLCVQLGNPQRASIRRFRPCTICMTRARILFLPPASAPVSNGV